MCADLPLFCGACFAGFCEFLFFSDCVLLFSVPDCCNCFLVFGASVFCGMVRCVLPACTCVCGFLPVFSGGGINENCSPEIDCPGEQFFALCYILYFLSARAVFLGYCRVIWLPVLLRASLLLFWMILQRACRCSLLLSAESAFLLYRHI